MPATPTATDVTICKETTTTLIASGAVGGDKYKWYDVATGGTPLKTSTNNTDNTYLTATITNTTSYWVSVLTSAGCESSRTPLAVTVSNPVASVYTLTNITCNGGHDGSITILASGGTNSTYQFSVDNGATYTSGTNPNPYTFNNLSANTSYKIRVKDSNECASPLIQP
jgi:hypothetical protein